MGQCFHEKRFEDLASRGPGAAVIKWQSLVAMNPAVHQGITGPGIPASHLALRGDQSDVGDSTNIDDGGRNPGLCELC